MNPRAEVWNAKQPLKYGMTNDLFLVDLSFLPSTPIMGSAFSTKFNPETDVGDLSGKVIVVTGGK